MKDKPETLIQPTMGIKWNSGSLLDMEAHMLSATQNNSKRTKRNNQENGRDGDITCTLPVQSYPTRFYQRAHPTYIKMSHMSQILKNPPEYTMQYSVQPGRNTKNEAHAHLLGNA